jgi:amino-acid N-acetyltransferase
MDDDLLSAVLQAGTAEWAGLATRRATLHVVRAALRAGVTAVNLCALDQIARELFTYEGAGTLFTLEDYCRVERLGIDDFEEVERLLDRGCREGYLKPRGEDEVARILLNGFGATIGTHHLAGVCGLLTEPYRDDGAGEISGLYTVTRFKSEGVGVRLINRAIAAAEEIGLSYVFACTVDERAATFFRRHGFVTVAHTAVPAAKWTGYDSGRRERLHVLRRDIHSA